MTILYNILYETMKTFIDKYNGEVAKQTAYGKNQTSSYQQTGIWPPRNRQRKPFFMYESFSHNNELIKLIYTHINFLNSFHEYTTHKNIHKQLHNDS